MAPFTHGILWTNYRCMLMRPGISHKVKRIPGFLFVEPLQNEILFFVENGGLISL